VVVFLRSLGSAEDVIDFIGVNIDTGRPTELAPSTKVIWSPFGISIKCILTFGMIRV
jgi:hypothetical protein